MCINPISDKSHSSPHLGIGGCRRLRGCEQAQAALGRRGVGGWRIGGGEEEEERSLIRDLEREVRLECGAGEPLGKEEEERSLIRDLERRVRWGVGVLV